jgi:hypothetical protein
VGNVDAHGEEGRYECGLALRTVEGGVVGSGGDDDDIAALGALGGQDGNVSFAIQADDGEEIYAWARARVREVAEGVVNIGDAVSRLAGLDLL